MAQAAVLRTYKELAAVLAHLKRKAVRSPSTRLNLVIFRPCRGRSGGLASGANPRKKPAHGGRGPQSVEDVVGPTVVTYVRFTSTRRRNRSSQDA